MLQNLYHKNILLPAAGVNAVGTNSCQETAWTPDTLDADKVAPDGIVTVSPEAPSVKVVPHCGSTVFTLSLTLY